jgi:diguanylate cyclase (GGDEF)-like protein/PAS domain S-box-containing protein
MNTARARALLAVVVLLVLLDGVVALGAFRVHNDHNARAEAALRAEAVSAIEAARGEVSREAALATSALSAENPSAFVRAYDQVQAFSDEALSHAKTYLIDLNDVVAADTLKTLSLTLGYLREDVSVALEFPFGSDGTTPLEAGRDYVAQIQPRLDQAVADLDQLIVEQQSVLAAQRGQANHASDVTAALLLMAGAFAVIAGSAIFALIFLSVTRPLTVLQSRVKALLSGEGEVSLTVPGPVEVASLAGDIDSLVGRCRRAEKATQAANHRYRSLFETGFDAVYIRDRDGRFLDGNGALLELLGCTREELLRSTVLDFFEESRRDSIAGIMNENVENGGQPEIRTLRLKRRDGIAADIEVVASVLQDEPGDTVVIGVARDVSYKTRAEEVLRGSEDKYREIFESVQDIFYRTDSKGIITEIGPAVERWGYTREELIGTQVLNVYPDPEERQGLLKELAARGEVTDYEVKLRAKNGDIRYSSVGSHLIRDADGQMVGVEGVLRDITERKNAEEALREQMRRDPLTGVLNHAAIVSELRDIVSAGDDGARCAVLMNDVDGLKAINDTFGHAVGDSVLVAIAESLSCNGSLVGRYGGDEFIAVLPGAGRSEAEQYKKQMLDALNGIRLQDPQTGSPVPVFLSTGIVIYPIEANRIEELIQLADSAMYAAKRQRREASSRPTTSHHRNDGDAARLVGEIVPYLTTTGNLEEKLRLVARRLSVAAGYDAVSFVLFNADPGCAPSMVTFARGPEKLLQRWNSEELKLGHLQDLKQIGDAQKRPTFYEELDKNPRFSDAQVDLLKRAGLKSGLSAPMLWRNELIGILAVASERENAFAPHDAQVLTAVATQVTAIVSLETMVEELRAASARLGLAHVETVKLLAAAAEAHDRTTGKHLRNVQSISEALARELGYNDDDARELGLAAVLHDMGKIRVADSVLANTGRLSAAEWDLMKQHAVWGEQFLTGRSGFDLAAVIARSHHERWDGNGYPDGLAGEGIPDAAAIVAVADSFDAMTSDRPYKPGRSSAAAMQEILTCSGTQFNPKVVQALSQLYRQKKLPRRRPRRAFIEEQAA